MDKILSPDEHEAREAENSSTVVPFHRLASLVQVEFCNTDKLSELHDLLAARRRSIIVAAATSKTIPSRSSIRQIAEIQIAIAAIESVEDEDISS
ncbi:hypothetical protein [Methylobacterium sp. P5_C11]